jgi:MFS family permease
MLASLAMFGRLPRDFRLYLFAFSSLSFGYFGILGVLFNLYLLRLGYGPEFIGLLIGGGQLVWGAAALPAGAIGARLGNRNALILGTAGFGCAIVLLLLTEALPPAFQNAWLMACWMLNWVCAAIFIVNGTPYVMSITDLEQRPHAFALQQAAIALFGFAGALIAGVLPGLLAGPLGVTLDAPAAYRTALWLTPLAYGMSTLFLLQTRPMPPAAHQTHAEHASALPGFVIVFVTVLVLCQTFGEGVMRAFFNVFLDANLGVPTARIGLIMGVAQLLSVGTALWAPVAMARWGAGRTVAWVGGFGGAAALALMALTSHWLLAGLAFTGVMCTVSIAATARSVFSQEAIAPQWRTAMSAAYTVGMAMGWAGAAALGGYIIAGWGYAALFALGAAAATASGVLVFAFQRLHTTQPARAPAQS